MAGVCRPGRRGSNLHYLVRLCVCAPAGVGTLASQPFVVQMCVPQPARYHPLRAAPFEAGLEGARAGSCSVADGVLCEPSQAR